MNTDAHEMTQEIDNPPRYLLFLTHIHVLISLYVADLV